MHSPESPGAMGSGDDLGFPTSHAAAKMAAKRKNSNGNSNGNSKADGSSANSNGRPVKRRASKACQCCRSRKVRCNVVEHGSPCTNCRLDEVECVVTESKRRKKHTLPSKLGSIHEQTPRIHHPRHLSGAEALASGSINPLDISNPAFRRSSHSSFSDNGNNDDGDLDDSDPLGNISANHVPHSLYAAQMAARGVTTAFTPLTRPLQFINGIVGAVSLHGDLTSTRLQTPPEQDPPMMQYVPGYIKPLPARMTPEDIHYLYKKGALSIPEHGFRNALLRAYVEFVHPYMPLIELHEFLEIVSDETGGRGKVSLVLFQAIMFTGTAFVDEGWLRTQGFLTRKAARKAFYLKARLLYDFDYEIDRVALVQSLLLMTYWYETPDDQKDTWHWMGVAISLAHTIGLHRNPEKSQMDLRKQRLWKRIWWSCFMRDRLVALGMRRPTRIKDEDYDVPMLTLDDFEIQELSPENTIIARDCAVIRDLDMQRDLAMMCIAKAKLSLIISHVLGAQYSVLVRDQGTAQGQEGNARSSVMLFPKKHDQIDEVKSCDAELSAWKEELPVRYAYQKPSIEDVQNGLSSVVVQRALLHMVYFATVSALHRPQVLPAAEVSSPGSKNKTRDLQDISRKKVRDVSRAITTMSIDLHDLHLERFLPTTGVTVLLPAIIIHLLDIKSLNRDARRDALHGFSQCMLVLTSLRDNYAAADYATQFLDAAIKKADINIGSRSSYQRKERPLFGGPLPQPPSAAFDSRRGLMNLPTNVSAFSTHSRPHTPPHDPKHEQPLYYNDNSGSSPKLDLNGMVTTPPQSDSQSQNNSDAYSQQQQNQQQQPQNHGDINTMLPVMSPNGPNSLNSQQQQQQSQTDLHDPTAYSSAFDTNFNELVDFSALDGAGDLGMWGFEGQGGGFGEFDMNMDLDAAGLAAGALGAHGESGGWVMDWEGEGAWGGGGGEGGGGGGGGGDAAMETKSKEGGLGEVVVVGGGGGDGELGMEESAVFLLRGAE